MARQQRSLVSSNVQNNLYFHQPSPLGLNLAIIFISMGFVAHSPPNFAAAQQSLGVMPGPVVTQKFTHLPLFSKVIQPLLR